MNRAVAILLSVLIFLTGSGFTKWSSDPVVFTDKGVIVRDPEYIEPVWILSDDDEDLLMRMAYSEARGEGIKGRALVMMVALNRWKNGHYGETLSAVIRPGRFTVANTYDDECRIALTWIKYGWDESEGALYFSSAGYNGPIPLFQYGGHWFSTREWKEKVYG